ncbi:MAG: phenylacetate--CoA ligase, partial [Alphaproteobacteria bacterium]
SDDMIILRGVNVFPTQIEEQLLAMEGLAPHFQIELGRTGRMDEMTVHVEALPDTAAPEMRELAARHLARRIKDVVGVTVAVRVADPGGVPRSQGKAVRIVDNRPKD